MRFPFYIEQKERRLSSKETSAKKNSTKEASAKKHKDIKNTVSQDKKEDKR
jgi:hypothetical protein